jgi:hypothetical protein
MYVYSGNMFDPLIGWSSDPIVCLNVNDTEGIPQVGVNHMTFVYTSTAWRWPNKRVETCCPNKHTSDIVYLNIVVFDWSPYPIQ